MDRFLQDCLVLFNDTFYAVFSVPILRFFLLSLLFMTVLRFVAHIVNQGKKGKL